MVDTDLLLDQLERWWMEDVYEQHKSNIEKLKNPKSFKINPFLHPYIANFLFGDTTPHSLASALVIPRAMGTSVATTFGNKMQKFITDNIDHAQGSAIPGIDIEFEDQTEDARPKRYCQVKAGPNTINADDVRTIVGKFTGLLRKARTDRLKVDVRAPMVGVLYGTPEELSSSYRKIEEHFGVFIGMDFWAKLTGDVTFYDNMAEKLRDISAAINEQAFVEEIIQALSETDEIIQLASIGIDASDNENS